MVAGGVGSAAQLHALETAVLGGRRRSGSWRREAVGEIHRMFP